VENLLGLLPEFFFVLLYIKGENIADEKFFALRQKDISGYSLPEVLFKLRTGRGLSLPGLFLSD